MPKKTNEEISEQEETENQELDSGGDSSESPPSSDSEPVEEKAEEKAGESIPLERAKNDLGKVEEFRSGSLASDVGGLPPVDPEAINSEASSGEIPEEFNPEIHATDKDGNGIPLKSKKGWRKKSGRAAQKAKLNLPEQKKAANEAEKLAAEQAEAEIKGSCQVLGHVNLRLLSTVFDVEADKKEKEELIQSYEPFVRESGGVKFPVWALPIVVSFGIVSNHLSEERPKTRMEKIKEFSSKSFRNMWLGFKDWRKARKNA